MKKFLLLGATGLIGHGITRYLLENEHFVYGTSRQNLTSHNKNFIPVLLNLKNDLEISQLRNICDSVDCIIFNAAQLRSPTAIKEDFYKVNVDALNKVISICPSQMPLTLISGTGLINHDNLNSEDFPFVVKDDYLASKAIAEIIAMNATQEGRISGSILRVSAPYGYRPSQMAVLPTFIQRAKDGKDLELAGSGARQQCFTFVEDIGQACVNSLLYKGKGIYNICSDKVVSMKELAEIVIANFSDSKSKIIFSGKPDPEENKKISFTNEKAKQNINFQPQYTISQGISRIKDYIDNKFVEYYTVNK